MLVTRPVDQAQPLVDALNAAGAMPIVYPTIGLEPPPSWAAFDHAVAALPSYDWIVFTSPSAVRFAFGRAPHLAATLGAAPTAVAAVGAQTAKRLGEYGVSVSLVPEDQRQEGLIASFADLKPGTRVLFPQAVGGRELLRDVLSAAGALVDVVPVSSTVSLPLSTPPPAFDAAIFASPSALKAFVAALTTAPLQDKVIAVIGPTTHRAAVESGLVVQVVPAAPSVAALVAALCAYRAGTAVPRGI